MVATLGPEARRQRSRSAGREERGQSSLFTQFAIPTDPHGQVENLRPVRNETEPVLPNIRALCRNFCARGTASSADRLAVGALLAAWRFFPRLRASVRC